VYLEFETLKRNLFKKTFFSLSLLSIYTKTCTTNFFQTVKHFKNILEPGILEII